MAEVTITSKGLMIRARRQGIPRGNCPFRTLQNRAHIRAERGEHRRAADQKAGLPDLR